VSQRPSCPGTIEFAGGGPGLDQVFPIHPQITVRLGGQDLTLVIHMVELLQLDRLLYVGYFEPKDDASGNRRRCEAYFSQHAPASARCIAAWDFHRDGPPAIGTAPGRSHVSQFN
jgi:hypothetical protein